MNKKQYNNVIDWTLKHEAQAQSEDTLEATRAICKNLGVALPGGTMKEVADTLATDDYMYWRSYTMQEAQEAADNGTPAIGVSDQRIVLLAATDEEQPVTATAAVMTLDENTPAYAVEGMRYYVYGYGTTTGGTTVVIPEEPEEPEDTQNRLNPNQVINQVDTSIHYPSGMDMQIYKNPAFKDTAFMTELCGKNSGSFTIANSGCAICCVASYILYKSGVACTNDHKFKAVELATKNATNENAWLNSSANFNATIGGQTVNIRMNRLQVEDVLAGAKNAILDGEKCIICLQDKNGNFGHFVLADAYDEDGGAELTRFLVCDPDGGVRRTLYDAVEHRRSKGYPVDINNFTCRIIY